MVAFSRKWQQAHPGFGLIDRYQRTFRDGLCILVQDLEHNRLQRLWHNILGPYLNHTWSLCTRHSQQGPKIKIMCENCIPIGLCPLHNHVIWSARIANVQPPIPLGPILPPSPGKDSYQSPVSSDHQRKFDLFGSPSGISKRLTDVIRLQIRIGFENLGK